MKLRLPDPIKPLGALFYSAAGGVIVTAGAVILPHIHVTWS